MAMKTVQCQLCPKRCVIAPGESGECRIRVNTDGVLRAVTYGYPSAVHVDPVEKKPLYHFLPGSHIFSIATVGCNLHCKNCQNWELSQCNPEDAAAVWMPPEEVVRLAQEAECSSVAFTYSDPIVWYEYMLDTARAAQAAGLRTVWVTAGYINQDPLRALCRHLDAANIDIKAFSDRFYRDVCDATLQPVLDAVITAKSMGVMVEITNLVIPTLNDSDEDFQGLCGWILEYLGAETPVHFSRFHPQHRMRHIPPTPDTTLNRARDLAMAAGLRHVYIGNLLVPESGNTYCPGCERMLVKRVGYRVMKNELTGGVCPHCNTEVYGLWQ